MTLTDYVHQVLIEENPYTGCPVVADRFMTYEDSAVSIVLDLMDAANKNPIETIVTYWLRAEFGDECLNEQAVTRSVTRIKQVAIELRGSIDGK